MKKYKNRESTLIIREVKNIESILMGKDGIKIEWYESKQTLSEVLMNKFYESEFDIFIVGRQYGKDPDGQITVNFTNGRQYGKDPSVIIGIEYW